MAPIRFNNLVNPLKKLKFLLLILTISCNNYIFCDSQDTSSKDDIISNNATILDKVAISINEIIITESEIQFLMNVLESKIKHGRDNTKVNINRKHLREQAIQEIIYLTTCHKIMKVLLEQTYNNIADFNSDSNMKMIEKYIKANSFISLSKIGYEIITANMGQSEIKKLQTEIFSEAQKLRLDNELYFTYYIHTLIANEITNNLANSVSNTMILSSQINSEIEKIIQEILHESIFRVEKVYYELPSKRKDGELKRLYNNMNDFLTMYNSSNYSNESSLIQAISQYEKTKKVKDKPKYKRYKLQWNKLSPILMKSIQTLQAGQICGPFEENGQLVLYKVIDIKTPNIIQEVKKYNLRILFKQVSAINNDAVLCKKLKNWIKLVEKGEETFKDIVLKHSDVQKNTREDGIIEWKQIDHITNDPKLQQEIQKLNNNNRLSPPIKCKDGWYIIEFLGSRIEEEDLSKPSSLKELARIKIINKSTEKIVKGKIEQEKQKLKLKFYD